MASIAEKDDLSDDSSDDEYLTQKDNGGSHDREALIRKKLMESFYGKSFPEKQIDDNKKVADVSDGNNDDEDDDSDDEKQEISRDDEIEITSDDLDSPYFNSDAHTSKYVLQGNMRDVLEVEERLALQVRTLDSTMQTLVYENYSKFIDATDAIRSIGVSVNANEKGLGRLSKGILVIDAKSQSVEDALGTLRDAVAEKLRVKRLLTRLDGLLKLPKTLRQQMNNCRYRLVTKSYLSAHAILKKHTAEFESLKTIEVDCFSIMSEMVQTLKKKLMYWSGQSSAFLQSFTDDTEDDLVDVDPDHIDTQSDEEEEGTKVPKPPKSISEIFECASTLRILLPKEGDEGEEGVTFDSGLSGQECKAAALSATIRYLERVIDSHQIQLQEGMFHTDFVDDTFDSLPSATEVDAVTTKQSNLIPTAYLDNILEATTLFNISFSADGIPSLNDVDHHLVLDFVKESFSYFLSNVKSLLLERIVDNVEGDEEINEKENIMADDEEDMYGDEAYSEVSAAMTLLVHSVRELASGLALPDVGINVNFASSLVEQAINVTETMVRKRVAQKFMFLRQHVAQDCLGPFIKDSIALTNNSETIRVVEIVKMASVTLSDGLQLVDDTVKSILTRGVVVSDLKGVDYVMVKEAVQDCCRRFAIWLAGTLEILAGCENPDENYTIEAEEKTDDFFEDATSEATDQQVPDTDGNIQEDDTSEMEQDNIMEKVNSIVEGVIDEVNDAVSEEAQADLVLAISEMCRLAQQSVMDSINQSIISTAARGKKHTRKSGIFASNDFEKKDSSLSEEDAKVSTRFLLAASRTLTLYGINRGSQAAFFACRDLSTVAREQGEDFPKAPREGIISLLHIAKETSIACANVFGGERRAGPEPEPLQDEDDVFHSGGSTPFKTKPISTLSGIPSVKGLQLDVERMFAETTPTFPHPSSIIDFSRNAVVFLVLKVAFNAIVEQIRICTCRSMGYRQIQVDVLFLRFLLPHYVKDDLIGEGKNGRTVLDNVLNDVVDNAGERCLDLDCVGQDKIYNPVNGESITLQSVIRDFMMDNDQEEGDKQKGNEHIKSKFVIEEDGNT